MNCPMASGALSTKLQDNAATILIIHLHALSILHWHSCLDNVGSHTTSMMRLVCHIVPEHATFNI